MSNISGLWAIFIMKGLQAVIFTVDIWPPIIQEGESRHGDNYDSFNSKLSVNIDVTNFLKMGINVQYVDRDESQEMANLGQAFRMSPYSSKYEADGKTLKVFPLPLTTMQNPYLFDQFRDQLKKDQSLFATIIGEIKLPFGFSYQISFANRYGWKKIIFV